MPATKKAPRSTKTTEPVDVAYEIPEVKQTRMVVVVRDLGESLIIGRMTEEAKDQMRRKQLGLAAKPRGAKDPNRCFFESMYFIGETPRNYEEWAKDPEKWGYGLTADAVKRAIVAATGFVDGAKATTTKGTFFIPGRLVRIRGTPSIREDIVNNTFAGGRKVADLRYRSEFKPPWSLVIPIVLHHPALSPEQLLALIDRAGLSVGVGSWRTQTNGQHGMFEVVRRQPRRAPLDEKWWDDEAAVTTVSDSDGPTEPKPAPEASRPTSPPAPSKKRARR